MVPNMGDSVIVVKWRGEPWVNEVRLRQDPGCRGGGDEEEEALLSGHGGVVVTAAAAAVVAAYRDGKLQQFYIGSSSGLRLSCNSFVSLSSTPLRKCLFSYLCLFCGPKRGKRRMGIVGRRKKRVVVDVDPSGRLLVVFLLLGGEPTPTSRSICKRLKFCLFCFFLVRFSIGLKKRSILPPLDGSLLLLLLLLLCCSFCFCLRGNELTNRGEGEEKIKSQSRMGPVCAC